MHAATDECSSMVGMEAASTGDQPTMTLNLSNKDDDPEFRKYQVIEMFGRALGLEDEEPSTESPDGHHW